MHVFVTRGDSPSGQAVIKRLAEGGHSHCQSLPDESLDSTAGAKKILARVTEKTPLNGVVFTEEIFTAQSVAEGSEEDFDRIFDTLASRAFFTAKVFGHHLMDQKKGSMVFLSSIHADKPTGLSFAYSTALGAMEMLCREASLELGRHGVRINAVRMGGLPEEGSRYEESPLRMYSAFPYTIPRNNLIEWADFAKTAEFLLGPEGESINGTEITVDAGITRGYFQLTPLLQKIKAEKSALWDEYREKFNVQDI